MNFLREWSARLLVLAALVVVVALPFTLRTRSSAPERQADETVVVITPHNEAIRSEIAHGFEKWFVARTGRTVAVDWRVPGGTSEISRYLQGEYVASFRLHWTRDLHHVWSANVQASFDNPAVKPDGTNAHRPTQAQLARREFLASHVSSGADVFFGGGAYDFIKQAAAGRLVDSGIFERRPEWFGDAVIPGMFGGERLWARDHAWVGTVVSSFGILYNRDALARLGIAKEPQQWSDLVDARYFGEIALADPTKSSSIGKAFEMVIQLQMQRRFKALRAAGVEAAEAEDQAVREGWLRGFEIIQLMGANARYFTDSSQKPPIDVGQGDAAAGLCIDFYGRYQAGASAERAAQEAGRTNPKPRLAFVTPPGGSVFSPDPIAMLRGAPHREVALDFIEFVLSPEGQNLWNFRAGEPGGPETYALRRLPIRKDSFAPELAVHRSDPEVNPYADENDFEYHAAWTGGIFGEMSFLIRAVCIDPHEELVSAWRAIISAGQPAAALDELQDFSAIDYDTVCGSISAQIRSGKPIDTVRLARDLSVHFREQYQRAEARAKSASAQH